MSVSRFSFPWTRRTAPKLSHRNALARLRSLGFAPQTIYDIGAYRGGWTRLAADVFPRARFVLFEANADHASELAACGQRHVIAALGAQDGGARAFHVPRLGDYNKNAPLIADVIAALDRAGLRCADLCEVHRTPQHFVLQLDLLFVRPPLFGKYSEAAGLG